MRREETKREETKREIGGEKEEIKKKIHWEKSGREGGHETHKTKQQKKNTQGGTKRERMSGREDAVERKEEEYSRLFHIRILSQYLCHTPALVRVVLSAFPSQSSLNLTRYKAASCLLFLSLFLFFLFFSVSPAGYRAL